jgi:hypothetical protein
VASAVGERADAFAAGRHRGHHRHAERLGQRAGIHRDPARLGFVVMLSASTIGTPSSASSAVRLSVRRRFLASPTWISVRMFH